MKKNGRIIFLLPGFVDVTLTACSGVKWARVNETGIQRVNPIMMTTSSDAFSGLNEFPGQQYINEQLREMGFKEVQIIHRLAIPLTEEPNRYTNPIQFVNTSG